MSSTNAQFEAVRTAVNDALDKGDVSDYVALLRSKTDDVEGFLKWADEQPVADLPQLTAAEALAKLQSTNFRDMASVRALTDALQSVAPIPLVQDKTHEYIVAPVFPSLTIVSTTTVDQPEPAPGNKLTVHPSFLSLVQDKPTSTPARPPPRFVYPLGSVFKRGINAAGAQASDPEDTNYVAVIDVVATDHPVWLIYNRHPYDVDAGEPIDADPAKQPVVFPGVGSTNFDNAQAIKSLGGWSLGTGGSTPARPQLADLEALARQTRGDGAVVPSSVWLADLERALASPGAAAAAP